MKLFRVTQDYQRFVRHAITEPERNELLVVDRLAGQLVEHLELSKAEIDAVHICRAQSSAVQKVVARLLTAELGFEEEVVLRPERGFTTRARPDFIYRLGRERGILAEVERGTCFGDDRHEVDVLSVHIFGYGRAV